MLLSVLLSSASDAQVAKLIVLAVVAVVAYLIVPLIRKIRDNARKNRKAQDAIDDEELNKQRGKKFLLYAVLSFVGVIIVRLLASELDSDVVLILRSLFWVATLVFLVLGIVFFVKSKN